MDNASRNSQVIAVNNKPFFHYGQLAILAFTANTDPLHTAPHNISDYLKAFSNVTFNNSYISTKTVSKVMYIKQNVSIGTKE